MFERISGFLNAPVPFGARLAAALTLGAAGAVLAAAFFVKEKKALDGERAALEARKERLKEKTGITEEDWEAVGKDFMAAWGLSRAMERDGDAVNGTAVGTAADRAGP